MGTTSGKKIIIKITKDNKIGSVAHEINLDQCREVILRNDNKEIISIIVDLMYNNPNLYQICVIILSKLLSFENKSNKELIIKCIEEKFSKLPNTDYLSIWLQRITLTYNAKREFNSKICKIIYDSTTKLWNSSCLNIDINEELIVDKLLIKELTPVISSKELDIFDDYNW